MSEIKVIHTLKAPQPIGPYSQAVQVGGQLYVSGQIPFDVDGKLVSGTIAEKTKQCCENLKAILEEAGSGINRVVKTTIFLSDMAHFKEMNGVYGEYFAHKPARSCVAVKELPLSVDVEIECIALAGRA